jgi:hypothetical protein
MDLKKYLKDTKSKEIISQYIEQTKQQQLDYVAPIRPIEEEKKKAQKTIEKEKVKEPLALKGTEKALEDMDEYELAKYIGRDDISISDRKKASKLLIKLQRPQKKMLAIEAPPKKEAAKKEEAKPAPKKEEAKKEEAEVVREVDPVNLTDEQALKQLEPPIVEDEGKAKIRERIVEIYKFKDIIEGKIKGTLPFKNEDEMLEYTKSFKQDKKDWKTMGGNTSTITTPLNKLKIVYYTKIREEKLAEQKRQAEEAEAKELKEEKKAKAAAKKAKAKAATETK